MTLEQLLDEARGFEFVELFHTLAEAVHRKPLDVLPVEPVLIQDLDDEILLLGCAVPGFAVTIAVAVAGRGVAVAVPVARVGEAVAIGICFRQVADISDAGVHAVLEEPVEPGCLGGSLRDVGDFGFNVRLNWWLL